MEELATYGNAIPDFDEVSMSQIPAILQLLNLGYVFCRDERADKGRAILRERAFAAMRKINDAMISDKSIFDAIDRLEKVKLDDGIQKASEDVFADLLGGVAVSEIVNGKKLSPQMRLIDWEHAENNDFALIPEFGICEERSRRPDIVLFVNGIPLAVIECKKSSVPVDEAIDQLIRNQRSNQTPRFFLFPQLLVGTNVMTLKYGTQGTPREFYSVWKEKDVPEDYEAQVLASVNKSVPAETLADVLASVHYHGEFQQAVRERVTAQDVGIFNLLRPERLLDLVRNFILCDNGVKKVARYQQFFAIKRTLARIQEFDENGRRKGGLIWHTQGSGKSLTMVMLVKNLIERVANPRVIVVTDRTDLDAQIRDTFKACAIKVGVQQATSSKDLIEKIASKTTDVITTLVHKFERGGNDFCDDGNDIFLLIDEAHRTQGGDANAMMNHMLPRACQIAFTGTPLMKNEKSKRQFGGFIDTYTIAEALEDGAILPLIYQGRFVDQKVDEAVDEFYETIAKHFSWEQRQEFEKKCVSQAILAETSQRIESIAKDVAEHYCANFQGTGLKAQLVAPSKYAAVMFKKALDLHGGIKSEVVISESNFEDAGEDKTAENKRVVADFLAEEKRQCGSLDARERKIIQEFKKDPNGCELLIVVDKLLTGFDAPCNTVLYLAKQLREHNLFQAIARVNRLFDGNAGKQSKTFGYIIDYSKNAKNLRDAMTLFSGYEESDVAGALLSTEEQIRELEKIHSELLATFQDVPANASMDAFVQTLAGDEETRNKFYETVNQFIRQFDACFSLYDFHAKFDGEKLAHFRKDLKRFVEIKKTTQLVLAEKVDFSKFRDQLHKLLDKYVSAEQVEILSKEISLSNLGEFNAYVEDAENGLSERSKAKAIAAQTNKLIRERYSKDEVFYKRFSDRIAALLQEIENASREDVGTFFEEMKKIQAAVEHYEDSDLPEVIRGNKVLHPFYRNLAPLFGKSVPVKSVPVVIDFIVGELRKNKKVDFESDIRVKRTVVEAILDFLFDEMKARVSPDEAQAIAEKAWELAVVNRELI